MASFAPASLKRWAMAQAMLRLLATPNITAFFPCMLSITSSSARRETAQDNRNGQRRGVTEEIPCFSCKIFLKNGDNKNVPKGGLQKNIGHLKSAVLACCELRVRS